jgi:hypothetical protein
MPVITIDTANTEATAMNVSIARLQSFWVVVLCGVLIMAVRLGSSYNIYYSLRPSKRVNPWVYGSG